MTELPRSTAKTADQEAIVPSAQSPPAAHLKLTKLESAATAHRDLADGNPSQTARLAPAASSTPPAILGAGAESTPGLTLLQAINQALVANPDLVALRGRLDVNQAMVGVARTYPWNPFVQAQFLPRGHPFVPNEPGIPASGAGQSNYYIWAMQRFELAHQRQFRIQGALASLDQMQWNLFQAELQAVAQTTRLYFAALYQQEVHELAQETAELNARLAGIVERRFKANLARAGDVTTAKVVARQSGHQAELAETTYRAALLALHQQLNLPVTRRLLLTEKLAAVKWLPLESNGLSDKGCPLAEELVQGRPDVLAAEAGVRVSEANFKLARAAIVPDIQAGPIYETADDGTRYLGLRLQMNVPLFDTGAPLARQRRAEMNVQQLTSEQLKVRATLEAQVALDQYQRVRDLAAKAPPAGPGGMPPELQEITSQFEAGQADILAVLTTQNNLLQERRLYLDMLNQLAQSAAAVIQATGLPPDRVIRLTDAVSATGDSQGPKTPVQLPFPRKP